MLTSNPSAGADAATVEQEEQESIPVQAEEQTPKSPSSRTDTPAKESANSDSALHPTDIAFRDLQTCPGGHLTAKSSGGKSKDTTAADRETSKRVRVALNVLHFKNALQEMRDQKQLFKAIANVFNVYHFARTKDLKRVRLLLCILYVK